MQEGWYEMQGEVYAWVQQPVYYAKDILGYIILAKPLDQATLQSWMPSGLSLQKDGDHQGYSVPLGILKPQNDANTPIHLSLHVQLSLNTLSQQQHKLELGLAAALCLSLLLWMYVFKRYIGHAIQRLESLKNNVTNMQWREEIEQPQIIEDEVDILRVAFSDLSVRLHQKQQLLQEKTDLLETILHTSPMAIWMTDCQGQVQFINQNMQQLLGLDNTDNVQLPPLFCEQSNIALENKDGDFIHFQNKLLMLPLNGKSYSFDGVCSQIHDGAYQLVGVVGLALDITARNQAQHDVAVMKKKVTHVQRLEGLGVLASGIAHDFNNLLSVIMGNAEIAQYDLDTHHSNQNLLKIVDASKRASELCQQLLAYAGEANYDWKAIDISTHIKDISELLSVSHDKKITIDLQLCDTPSIIKADVAQFQQVVMNLVINATESMEGQTGIVRIETGLETLNKEDVQYHLGSEDVTSGIYAFIRIQDEGCGMDESTLNNIFDPFFTTKFTGRGLGMSAVLGIVRSHRGSLNIQSKLGDGTTMTVYFPLASSAMVSKYPLGMSMNTSLK